MALYLGNKKVCPIIFKYKDIELLKGIIEGTAKDIVLPDSITKIADDFFRGGNSHSFKDSSIKSIKANEVTEIGVYSIYGHTNSLKTIELPNLKIIGDYGLCPASVSGYKGCVAEKIILGKLEYIGKGGLQGLFYNKNGITQEIQMSFNNCVIGEQAFRYNESITSFDATGVKSFEKYVFSDLRTSMKCWLPSTIEAINTTGAASGKSLFAAQSQYITVTIYTDIPDENSVPSTWGKGWNYSYGGPVTMVYGATYEDFLNA